MAGVPPNFQAISNVLANYDFVDIVSGTGIINLYAGKTADLTLLSNNNFYSEPLKTTGSSATTEWVKLIDLDFDVVLNRPLSVMGKVVVNVPIRIEASGSNDYAFIRVTLRKYSGSETDIATNDSTTSSITGVDAYFMKAIDLNVPLTHFKIGDTLRLTIEGHCRSPAGAAEMDIAHDPMNRSTGWDSTAAVPSKLVFQCPVRLNL